MAVKPDKNGVVKGTDKNDIITWVNTNDWLRALTVNAGNGHDKIDFKKSKYKNTLNGGAGKDTIYGGTKDDKINGGAGNDALYGYNGNDTILGGDGDDSLYGGNGIDSLVGGNGKDTIDGGAGFGRLFGLKGEDYIIGGKDKDTIDGGDDNDILYGGGDNDTVKGNTGNDYIEGNDGDDKLFGMADNDTLYGGKGDDLLDGSNGNDSLIAQDGKDTIRAGAGDDYMDGGNGDDQIVGHSGNDTMYGGAGDDFLDGGNGNDKIYGGNGKDLIRGGSDNDYIDGGDGDDNIQGQFGNNTLIGGKGNDTIFGGKGNDSIEGGEGNDNIQAREGNDIIYTGAGNDKVDGGIGNDIIYGNIGNNTLIGGLGDDSIYADGGSNIITYKKDSGNDVYFDVSEQNDLVQFTGFSYSDYLNFNPQPRKTNNDLIIYFDRYDRSNGIRLKEYLNQNFSDRLQSICFADFGDVYLNLPYTDVSGITNMIEGSVHLYGTSASEEFFVTDSYTSVHSSDGDDTVNFNHTGNNTYVLSNNPTDNTLFGLNGSDTILASNITKFNYWDVLAIETGVESQYVYIPNYMDDDAILDTRFHLNNDYEAKLRTFISDSGVDIIKGKTTLYGGYLDTIIGSNGAVTISTDKSFTGSEIHTGNKNDVIDIKYGDNKIYTNGGNDSINIYGGNNQIAGGLGNDSIWIEGGVNVVHSSYNNDNDTIIVRGGTNTIYMNNSYEFFYISGGINNIIGTEDSDNISVYDGYNTIVGSWGNDKIWGSTEGGNTYLFEEGDGTDTIESFVRGSLKSDTLKFVDTAMSDLTFYFQGKNAVIQYGYDLDDKVIFDGFLNSADDVTDIYAGNIWVVDKNNERCRLTDLYYYDLGSSRAFTQYSDEKIFYQADDGSIKMGLGNDTITICNRLYGVNGGEGANTYMFSGDLSVGTIYSYTYVTSTSGKDTVVLDNKPFKTGSYASITNNNRDLSLYITNGGTSYYAINFYGWYSNPVEIEIEQHIGSTTNHYNICDIEQSQVNYMISGTTGDDTIADTNTTGIINGRAGNDKIDVHWYYGGASTIFGGEGDDTINGASYNDLIYTSYATKKVSVGFGEIKERLLGQGGNDTLCAFGDNAELIGGAAIDTYRAYTSNNIYINDSYDDNILFIETPDNESKRYSYIVMDVNKSAVAANGSWYYVLNQDSYEYWLNNGSFDNARNVYGGIKVWTYDYEGEHQALQQIHDEYGRVVWGTDIQNLAQEVALWLTDNGFESVGDVIKTGTNDDKSALTAIFDNFNNTQWKTAMG